MKLSHLTIIFLIIILPFSIIARNNLRENSLVLKDQVRLNNIIDTATMDALDTLVDINDEFQMLYSDQRFDVNQPLAKEAVKSFFKTLAVNFNMPYIEEGDATSSVSTETYFSRYVPAILIIGYDGFFVYSVDESGNGYAYQMSPKIPYSYVDETTGAIINFSLGNDIKIFTNGKFYEGILKDNYIENSISRYNSEYVAAFDGDERIAFESISDLTDDMSIIIAALYGEETRLGIPHYTDGSFVPSFFIAEEGKDVPLLQDYERESDQVASSFHALRRKTIIHVIQETLKQEINSHSAYASVMGSNFDFQLPVINDEEWSNSINDISVMSFIQGIPIGLHSYYNNYAIGASRIVKTDYLYGSSDNGKKLYHRLDCDLISNGDCTIDHIFLNRGMAAENGYWPCRVCEP